LLTDLVKNVDNKRDCTFKQTYTYRTSNLFLFTANTRD